MLYQVPHSSFMEYHRPWSSLRDDHQHDIDFKCSYRVTDPHSCHIPYSIQLHLFASYSMRVLGNIPIIWYLFWTHTYITFLWYLMFLCSQKSMFKWCHKTIFCRVFKLPYFVIMLSIGKSECPRSQSTNSSFPR